MRTLVMIMYIFFHVGFLNISTLLWPMDFMICLYKLYYLVFLHTACLEGVVHHLSRLLSITSYVKWLSTSIHLFSLPPMLCVLYRVDDILEMRNILRAFPSFLEGKPGTCSFHKCGAQHTSGRCTWNKALHRQSAISAHEWLSIFHLHVIYWSSHSGRERPFSDADDLWPDSTESLICI